MTLEEMFARIEHDKMGWLGDEEGLKAVAKQVYAAGEHFLVKSAVENGGEFTAGYVAGMVHAWYLLRAKDEPVAL